MTKFTNLSEKYFANYLRSLGLYWEYEKDWGGKKPDFTIFSDKEHKKIVAIADVKEFDYTKAEKRILKEEGFVVGGGHAYKRIRSVIDRGREQFKHTKQYPCILVLYSSARPVLVSHLTLLGAMLGDITISIPLKHSSKSPKGKSEAFFGKGGKMIHPKLKTPQNQTISAIGILDFCRPEEITSGYDQQLKKKTKHLNMLKGDGWEEFSRIAEHLEKCIKKAGFNSLKKVEPNVDFLLNPFSRLPFPDSFFKKGYSYIHRYDLKTGQTKPIFDWSRTFSVKFVQIKTKLKQCWC